MSDQRRLTRRRFVGLFGSWAIYIKRYGAGWPHGTRRYYWRLSRNGSIVWQDTRVKYSATNFSYSTVRDCPGGGIYELHVECRGAYSTFEWDADGVWV